jgi:hypothetical protein
MRIHRDVKLGKNLRITPKKLEELGKILEINLWIRAHSKETLLKMIEEEMMHRNDSKGYDPH